MEPLHVYILAIMVLIGIMYLIAKEFQNIAEMKGYHEQKYFWFSFLLGIPGYLMIIALPNRSQQNTPTAPNTTSLNQNDLPEL